MACTPYCPDGPPPVSDTPSFPPAPHPYARWMNGQLGRYPASFIGHDGRTSRWLLSPAAVHRLRHDLQLAIDAADPTGLTSRPQGHRDLLVQCWALPAGAEAWVTVTEDEDSDGEVRISPADRAPLRVVR